MGSGVIVSPDGFIITNNHVIEDATKIEVTTNDNVRYVAELVGTDPYTDIAVLKIKPKRNSLPLLWKFRHHPDWGMGFGHWESL